MSYTKQGILSYEKAVIPFYKDNSKNQIEN